MFTDDTVFVAHSHQHAQEMITLFSKSAKAFGLEITLKKSDVIYQPPPESHDIQTENQVLTQVNKFKYLGSTVANKNRLDAELDTQVSNTFKAFGRLRKRDLFNKDFSIKTKCAVYRVIVLSIRNLDDIQSGCQKISCL